MAASKRKTTPAQPEPQNSPPIPKNNPLVPSPECTPKLSNNLRALKEGLYILEREFMEFRERTLTILHQCTNDNRQPVEEIYSMVRQHKDEIGELQQAMRELEEDKQSLRTALRTVTEELAIFTQSSPTLMLHKETKRAKEDPCSVQPPTPLPLPYPLSSPTLSKAMEQISNENFQGVKHILIHTGTNDLMGHNKIVPHMLKEIAMKATTEFPAARNIKDTALDRNSAMPQIKTRSTNSQAKLPWNPHNTKTYVHTGPSLSRGPSPALAQYSPPLQAPQGHDNW
ncbi:hypothetical protein SKAU_G00096200 [Synaphobranchus kaupii]|uniref:Uncharacterized protein n=1 Tax=Synaphobranchus kaupii TaxID=118154 RepID=A0A9Q1FY83_SYNKA|nr:hypothetical protein SKAU_G00096200 [Synaphobranchus kaupii]